MKPMHFPLRRFGRLAVVPGVVAAVLLAGCASAPSASPEWDRVAGDAMQVLRVQQTLEPKAAQLNGTKQPAQPGRTVREALERHTDSYRNPPQPSTVINLGR